MKVDPTLQDPSSYIGKLSEGCVLCGLGAKMVLFETGLCSRSCFYCPISEKKSGHDVIYANERPVSEISEVMEEAALMDALGTGITGGDPLAAIGRTCQHIVELKRRFGKAHHIHLYTGTLASKEVLRALIRAGLDEIRFHIPPEIWDSVELSDSGLGDSIREAKELGLYCGIEVPVFPELEKELIKLCRWTMEAGADFINLNELEMNYINYKHLKARNYTTRSDISSAVVGSAELAKGVLSHFGKLNCNIHFCTVAFKDGVQLKNRIGRRARNVMKPYHEITEDNTLVRALIECSPTDDNLLTLQKDFDIPDGMIERDHVNSCLTTAWYIAEEINDHIPFRCAIVEEYPTYDRLEVERRYLD
ncbi:MAG: 4Fe-4S cluster-binding domain-containing protein [Candidatus Thermoplasmatota archaeon]|jgi:hypothetical protein|nr:4Fe-4S cluster-binding domain-containing protein [Candidatus Thermoplasmatota archaeon]MDP7265183.1 4Fe-4S cluster-binding domain-containing protein [Candidatus Thermoplasmatota archaeon]